ncbi:isochorismatase family protein [Thermoleophilum album]|uniref:isochorismatase family protein n=1 Tax=Thermoleophilum album TaxID=29539 RepID=UPI00237C8481|nr:isochorismatase family protein [Thermoleophilum album]WDT92826.1 isochorismatase family protein [Thermoleophilum album]
MSEGSNQLGVAGGGGDRHARVLLDPQRAALIVVDIQEAFAKAVGDFDGVAAAARKLVRGAHILGLPVIVSEQYPRGLGPTVPELAELLDGDVRVEKRCFAASAAEGFDLAGRTQALVCGIEAHVCVAQTALELLARGVAVHLVVDAVASRKAHDRDVALRRLELAGVVPQTVESALFELVRGADHPHFKEIQQLIK